MIFKFSSNLSLFMILWFYETHVAAADSLCWDSENWDF